MNKTIKISPTNFAFKDLRFFLPHTFPKKRNRKIIFLKKAIWGSYDRYIPS